MQISPEEEDEILQALAEGIKPSPPICEDCRDYYNSGLDDDDYDDDTLY